MNPTPQMRTLVGRLQPMADSIVGIQERQRSTEQQASEIVSELQVVVRTIAQQQAAMAEFLRSQDEKSAKLSVDQMEPMRQLQAQGLETATLYPASNEINQKLMSQEEILSRQSVLLTSQQQRTDEWQLEIQRQHHSVMAEMSNQQQNQR